MKPVAKLLPLFVAVVMLTSACGYRFSGEGAGPRPKLNRIAIPMFENDTTQAGLGNLFATTLRQDFILQSRMKVVPLNQAQLILRGRVTKISTSKVAQRAVEATVETRLYLTVSMRCVDAQTGEVVWQYPSYSYHTVYAESADPSVITKSRNQALEFLVQQMSIRIHDLFLSSF